jgi:hypothetical protein
MFFLTFLVRFEAVLCGGLVVQTELAILESAAGGILHRAPCQEGSVLKFGFVKFRY